MHIPKEVQDRLEEARTSLQVLETTLRSVFNGVDEQAKEKELAIAAELDKAKAEAEAKRCEAERAKDEASSKVGALERDLSESSAKLGELEGDLGLKADNINVLKLQVAQSADLSAQKEEEIVKLQSMVEALNKQLDSGRTTGTKGVGLFQFGQEGASKAGTGGERQHRSSSGSRNRGGGGDRGRHRDDHDSGRGQDSDAGRSRSPLRWSDWQDRDRGSDRGGSGGGGDRGWTSSRDGGNGGSDHLTANLCIPWVIGQCQAGQDCRLKHILEEEFGEARVLLRRKQCRWGSECRRSDCIFKHDGKSSDWDSRWEPNRFGGGGGGSGGASSSKPGGPKLCRYGSSCTRADCYFAHP